MSRKKVLRYFQNLAVIASQAANCVFLAGHPDQTISSRCHMNAGQPGWERSRLLINKAYFLQEDHCRASYDRDVENSTWFVETGRFPRRGQDTVMETN